MSSLAVRKNRGFSLVELMVSMAIISTTLLMIMGVFMTVFKASKKAVDLTAGTIFAESVLNRELRNLMTDPAERGKFFQSNNKVYAEGVDRLNEAYFTYKMYVTDVSFPTSISSRTDNKMKRVDVIVWWWGTGAEKNGRDGYGTLRTEVSRIVNQQAVY